MGHFFPLMGRLKSLTNSHKWQEKMGGNFRAAATIWSKMEKGQTSEGGKGVESAADIVLAQDGRVRALMRWETDSIFNLEN